MIDSERSTAKRDAAIISLLKETTIRAAAKRVGIGEATLRRWLRSDCEFRSAYIEARHEAFSLAIAQLRMGASEAATFLRETLADESESSKLRLACAKTILSTLPRGFQLEEDRTHSPGEDSPLVVLRFDRDDAAV